MEEQTVKQTYKLNKKTIMIIAVVVIVLFVLLTQCFGGGSDSLEDGGTLKPDHWYHYKDLDMVNVQNCYVSDAFVRNAGGVFVTYFPVCKSCHEMGTVGTAIVSEEESYTKPYFCDCGEVTNIIVKIIL